MIVLDANLLLYAYFPDRPQHDRAKSWLEETVASGGSIGLPWQTILAFLRISTNRKMTRGFLPASEAISAIDAWLTLPTVRLLPTTEEHWPALATMILSGQATADLCMDAHLAALTVQHRATLATNDRDFSRFPGLKVIYPLQLPSS